MAPALQPDEAFRGRKGSQERGGKVGFCPRFSHMYKSAWGKIPLEGKVLGNE